MLFAPVAYSSHVIAWLSMSGAIQKQLARMTVNIVIDSPLLIFTTDLGLHLRSLAAVPVVRSLHILLLSRSGNKASNNTKIVVARAAG